MAKKIILYQIGNEEKINTYIFDKKQFVEKKLSKLFSKIFNNDWDFMNRTEEKRNIEKFNDTHESLSEGKARIDAFYGNKKIFIMIHCSPELRLKFNRELFKIAKIPKPQKIKKIKHIKWQNRNH